MTQNVYLLEWYGPFNSPQEVLDWEAKKIGDGKTYLYLFKGKTSAKSRVKYYCGQAFKQSAGKRLTNKNHHINEIKSELDIWVAKFQNDTPKKDDVNLVENLVTSVLSQAILADDKAMLNRINKHRPKRIVYLINEWYYPTGDPRMKYQKGSIPCLLHDVLICYPHDDSSSIYGIERTKYINELQ